jgi:hypothetical protein
MRVLSREQFEVRHRELDSSLRIDRTQQAASVEQVVPVEQ